VLGYARARAEAARWRGDAAAAQLWQARAATLQGLVKTPRDLVLAAEAGL
jgi:hypothetical protein